MNNNDFPSKITGKSVEDIVSRLYRALSKVHPNAEEFRLDYLIIHVNALHPIKEKRELRVNSEDYFIKAFLKYNEEGKSTVITTSNEGDGTNIITYDQTDLNIYCKVNGQYSNQYYSILGGIQRTNAFLSGFKYHRSLIKKFLVSNKFMRLLRTNFLSKYQGVESFLKKVLLEANKGIDRVAKEPFYITIEQKTT